MEYTQEALWTLLSIYTKEPLSKNRIEFLFDTVFQFEKKYSRFIKGNFLDTLNTTGKEHLDDELLTLIRISKAIHTQSKGYFDITLLPILENLWYGISQDKLKKGWNMNDIVLWDAYIQLLNDVKIDLWGIGKWYLIDKLFSLLEKDASECIINFWGDIRVKWKHTVWLEDPLRSNQLIWKIEIENLSFCASSWEKRKMWNSHHLINPLTAESQHDKLWVFTTHGFATYADVYATTLFVAPLNEAIEILNKTKWLEAMIIAKNGEIYMSSWMNVQLF